MYNLSQRDFYTVVRNPYFRILSLWNYCVNTGLTEKEYSFEKFLIEKPSMDTLFGLTKNHGRSAEQRGIVYDIHDSQVRFIDDRVETFKLEEDLHILENKMGVKFAHCHKNSTRYNKPHRYFYTDKLQEVVYQRYKDDFERFNYSVDL